MRDALPPWPLAAIVLSGCAADIWDRRVYSCEEIDRIEVESSQLSVEQDDDEDEDDCFVQVQNLRSHSVDGGVLSGTELTVFASQPLQFEVLDTELQLQGDLTVDASAGDYGWFPEELRFEAAADSGSLVVDGVLEEVQLGYVPEVDLTAIGLRTLTGDVDELVLDVRSSNLARIDVSAAGSIVATLPRRELYFMDLEAGRDRTISVELREVEVEPTVVLELEAGNDLRLEGGPGGNHTPEPRYRGFGAYCGGERQDVSLQMESSFEGSRVQVDAVNSGADDPDDIIYESHRLVPDSELNLQDDDNFGYSASRRIGLSGPTGTDLTCAPDIAWAEDPLGSRMSYLVRVFDNQDRVLECYGLGHDAEGMVISGYYGVSQHQPDRINPNLCDLSYWAR